MPIEIEHYLNGRRFIGGSERRGKVYNPATGEEPGCVRLASAGEVEEAIRSGKDAFPAWAATPPLRRARILNNFLRIAEQRLDALAASITAEHGKTLSDARSEVQRGLEVVEFAIGAPHLLKGEMTEDVGPRIDSFSVRKPLGVVAGITPFNFPAMVPLWMFPVALACGNCFILKPSERAPSASLLLGECLTEAGLPPGVFSVVQGDKVAVDALLESPNIDAVSFVGSTPIARYVYETAARYGKRCQALGGAKNHMVIMPDADMDQAVDALMGAAFGSAGERCMAISVAVPVGQRTADEVMSRLAPRASGCASAPAFRKSPRWVRSSRANTWKRCAATSTAASRKALNWWWMGGTAVCRAYQNGYFIGPSVFDRVTPDMRIYREEIFGPVSAVVRADDYASAAQLVNEHEFGNGAAIFTRDGDTAREFAHQIRAGMVGVNVPVPVPMAFHSFGGWKGSLFGDHHMHGPEGVRFYTRMKTITSRWPTGVGAGAEYVMPNTR